MKAILMLISNVLQLDIAIYRNKIRYNYCLILYLNAGTLNSPGRLSVPLRRKTKD